MMRCGSGALDRIAAAPPREWPGERDEEALGLAFTGRYRRVKVRNGGRAIAPVRRPPLRLRRAAAVSSTSEESASTRRI